MSTSRTREKADGELFKSTGIDDNATSTAVTIDASENVGIGSTPATDWHSNYSVLQVGGQADIWTHKAVGAGKALHISHNAEYDTGFKYIANDEATLYVQGDGAHRFSHGAYGTAGSAISFVERLKIDFDGLTFQGNTGGAATALDDYEEGTFTVAITMATGTAAVHGSYNTLSYTKVGRLVTVNGQFRVGTVSSPDGELKINLPFTCANQSQGEGFSTGSYRTYQVDTPNDGTSSIIRTDPNSAYAVLEWSRDNAASTYERATANGYFMIGLTYITA